MTASPMSPSVDAQPQAAGGEAPLVLDTAPPRPLGFRDQAAFWANLGISLIGFSSAATVLGTGGQELSFAASVTAIVVGTVVGTAMLAVAAVIGARTGAPAMAVLRGLFGTRLSYVPTVLNIVQCVGWGVYELTVIAMGAEAMTHGRGWHWLYVVLAGAVTTTLTIRPLGAIGLLRRYVAVAVGLAMVYFTVQLARHGVPNPGAGHWHGFLGATDYVLAVSISFVPLAADYTRHSRTPGAAFRGTFSGYTVAQVWCYVLGLMALLEAGGDSGRIFDTFLGVTAGWAFFAVLVVREVDQSFANVYSTAMSVHNLFPRVDRRLLTVGIGVLVTALALPVKEFGSWYYGFLGLIGSVFVPLLAVLAVDYYLGRGRRGGWDLSEAAPARPLMLLPWLLGFAAYQFLAPSDIGGWWSDFWDRVHGWVHFTPQQWTSASLFAFLVAALATWALVPLTARGAGVDVPAGAPGAEGAASGQNAAAGS
ncbi:purine-cytosine permease family protein [Streptacidiphilus griseoplanus]|uniref:purine-cytosine permease family protein n=1 Tax=Peterkaempfera griseoplana TaxID=66896 RepID=UPI00099EA3A6|nr:cytosine permease [Peterkaempfera griseoplana]